MLAIVIVVLLLVASELRSWDKSPDDDYFL